MPFFKNIFINKRGQSFLEGLIISFIITVFMFAAIQVCITVVDDMFFNFVSFSATRKVIVSSRKEIQNIAKQAVSNILTPYNLGSTSVINYKTTTWNEEILGNKVKDHNGNNTNKYNVKIGYVTGIIFGRLFNNIVGYREQSARARMVKSPDEKYYNKAYPDAKNFPAFK